MEDRIDGWLGRLKTHYKWLLTEPGRAKGWMLTWNSPTLAEQIQARAEAYGGIKCLNPRTELAAAEVDEEK